MWLWKWATSSAAAVEGTATEIPPPAAPLAAASAALANGSESDAGSDPDSWSIPSISPSLSSTPSPRRAPTSFLDALQRGLAAAGPAAVAACSSSAVAAAAPPLSPPSSLGSDWSNYSDFDELDLNDDGVAFSPSDDEDADDEDGADGDRCTCALSAAADGEICASCAAIDEAWYRSITNEVWSVANPSFPRSLCEDIVPKSLRQRFRPRLQQGHCLRSGVAWFSRTREDLSSVFNRKSKSLVLARWAARKCNDCPGSCACVAGKPRPADVKPTLPFEHKGSGRWVPNTHSAGEQEAMQAPPTARALRKQRLAEIASNASRRMLPRGHSSCSAVRAPPRSTRPASLAHVRLLSPPSSRSSNALPDDLPLRSFLRFHSTLTRSSTQRFQGTVFPETIGAVQVQPAVQANFAAQLRAAEAEAEAEGTGAAQLRMMFLVPHLAPTRATVGPGRLTLFSEPFREGLPIKLWGRMNERSRVACLVIDVPPLPPPRPPAPVALEPSSVHPLPPAPPPLPQRNPDVVVVRRERVLPLFRVDYGGREFVPPPQLGVRRVSVWRKVLYASLRRLRDRRRRKERLDPSPPLPGALQADLGQRKLQLWERCPWDRRSGEMCEECEIGYCCAGPCLRLDPLQRARLHQLDQEHLQAWTDMHNDAVREDALLIRQGQPVVETMRILHRRRVQGERLREPFISQLGHRH